MLHFRTAATILGLLIIAGTCLDGYVKRNLSKSEDIGMISYHTLTEVGSTLNTCI